jgi:hypothetical protein
LLDDIKVLPGHSEKFWKIRQELEAGIKAKQRLNKIRKLEQQDNMIFNN